MQALRSVRSKPLPFLAGFGVSLLGVIALNEGLRKKKRNVSRTEGSAEVRETAVFRPMVAVYLDDTSVKMLRDRYPDAKENRSRKVVLEPCASDESLEAYERLYGCDATVKLTGEASSIGRRALAASVSYPREAVEQGRLPPAVDITPEADDGFEGGPLGSAVLIEQLRRAGAISKESWKGRLPEMSHQRHFPEENATYTTLKEPITVKGYICRSDWVDGVSHGCRAELKEAEGTRGSTPDSCVICQIAESSPCGRIFRRLYGARGPNSEGGATNSEDGTTNDEDGATNTLEKELVKCLEHHDVYADAMADAGPAHRDYPEQ